MKSAITQATKKKNRLQNLYVNSSHIFISRNVSAFDKVVSLYMLVGMKSKVLWLRVWLAREGKKNER